MKIAYFHYHLKTGGVTTVIRRQINAVKNNCDVLALSGEKETSDIPAETVYIPGAGYDGPGTPAVTPEKVAESIIQTIYSRWENGCDVFHVHNPTLAKSKNFLKVLNILKNNNINLFLQIHDFAEDGRSKVYFEEDEYINNCHYGVINSRDYRILLSSGLKEEGVHKIFNNVNPFEKKKVENQIKDLVLYPVRAIRRKNIGEAILLSLYFKENETLAITRPPNSDADISSYKGWKNFVKDNKLKVELEASDKYGYKDLVHSSKFFITTSITEGFGFSFLEPWTANKVLCGRKLPEICEDFEKKGVILDHLYTSLLFPVEWIGKDRLYEKWLSAVVQSSVLFGMKVDQGKLSQIFHSITVDGIYDFGLLDEAFQKEVMLRILSNSNDKKQLAALNPFLADISCISNKNDLIRDNSKTVHEKYSKARYRDSLLTIYETIIQRPVSHSIDKQALLLNFLNLESFSLLKWSDYIE